MALNVNSLVEAAKKTAKSLGLLATVTHEAYTGRDENGDPEYAAATSHDAVMSHGSKWMGRAPDGQESTVQITILEPMTIDKRDRFTLPDGTQPQIMNVKAPQIASGRPITEVWF